MMRTINKILNIFYYCFVSVLLKFIPKRLRYKSISGENVVITGAGNGLGRALALNFAKLGANVALLDIEESALKETEKLIQKQFPKYCSVKRYVCDITDRKHVKVIAEVINKEMGFVSILVNNAGVFYGKSILALSDDNIVNTFNVNTLSNFWTIREFLPNMLTANKGHIVSIASIAGKTGMVQMTDYCGSKHAVIGLTESLRLELSLIPNNNIKTTTVCPTFFHSNMTNGIRSVSAISVYNVNKVAEAAINAVLTDQEFIAIPNYLNCLIIIKAIIPEKALNIIYDILGVFRIMNNFKGRA